jgi:hypothetical protein
LSSTGLAQNQSISQADPWDPAVLRDPLEFQHGLREAGPVVQLEKYGIFAMGRYEHVHAALTNWQAFESGAGVGLSNWRTEKPWRPPSVVAEADPPHHDSTRDAIMKILAPRALGKLAKDWAADADELVDDLLGRTTDFDLMKDLARVFPLRIFPDAIGLPQEGRENLLPYSEHAFNSFGPPNDLVTQAAPRMPEIAAWVAAQCRREVLSEDGFGAQLYAAADRGDITQDHAPLLIRSLITAGVDTTVIGLGALLTLFAQNPEQWAHMRQDPALMRTAFDEAVRLDSPVQMIFRTTTQDIEVEGTFIPEGSKVLLVLASANRDPRRWDEPDSFDLKRDPSGHVGFGMGIHQCVGQHIARLEASAVLTALAKRVETIEIAGPVERRLNNTLRGWESVPVRVRLA